MATHSIVIQKMKKNINKMIQSVCTDIKNHPKYRGKVKNKV